MTYKSSYSRNLYKLKIIKKLLTRSGIPNKKNIIVKVFLQYKYNKKINILEKEYQEYFDYIIARDHDLYIQTLIVQKNIVDNLHDYFNNKSIKKYILIQQEYLPRVLINIVFDYLPLTI